MYELPTTVTVAEQQFYIRNKGDFRTILDCFAALQDEELSEDYRVLASLLIFYNDFNNISDLYKHDTILEDLINEMYKFMNCGQEQSVGIQRSSKTVDWSKDSQIICSAINNVANKEIRSLEYLHWWTFMGYYLSIGESLFATVVSIRDKMLRHTQLEKWEQEFKRNNPNYFVWDNKSVNDKEADKFIKEIWNKGGK